MPPHADDDFADTTQLHPRRPTSAPPAPRPRGKLLVLEGKEAGARFAVTGPTILGRGNDCEVVLDASSVSRHHARLAPGKVGEPVQVEDLGSRNGTFVNGLRVTGPTPLGLGDRLQLGPQVSLLFTHDDPLESLLRERQKMEVIGRMAAGVSHDFNNLIGAALTTLSHLESRIAPVTDAEVADCCADLRAALTHAAELTRGVATLGRRREATPHAAVSVSDVCAEVVGLCSRTFGAAFQVASDLAPDVLVHGNHTELHQVLLNLCINARDALPHGGRIEVGVRRSSAPGGFVLLTVADAGIGMGPQTRARIFEPFFTTKPDGRGTGLGLATVSELVRGMGGGLEVDSALGRGTCITVRLPAVVVASAPQRRPPSLAIFTAELAQGRVLVADDQAVVRRSIGRLLAAAGHDVLYACDGEEALRLFELSQPRPEVLVVDLDMPGGGGALLLETLAARPDPPAVVIVSGYWDPERGQELLRKGAAAYLGKPFDAAVLRNTVGKLVALRRAAARAQLRTA